MKRSGLFVLLLLGTLIVACNPSPSTPVATAVVPAQGGGTNPPLPTGFNVGADCTRASLNEWLARSTNLLSEFKATLNQNLATPAEQLQSVIDSLSSIRGGILVAPTPGCAEQHRKLIEDTTQSAIYVFTLRSTDQSSDFVAQMTRLNDQFADIDATEKQLEILYKALP